MGQQHNNNHAHNHNNLKGRNLLIFIFLNIIISVAQIIGGILSGSFALLSDALHNFSDVVSLVISYITDKLSKRKASLHKILAYKRAEILVAFINAATLLIVVILLIIEAIKRFQNPQEIESNFIIWLSFIAILGNGFSVLLLKKDSKSNMNIRSVYLHLLTDIIASVAVLFGGLLIKFYSIFWVDSVFTFIIAIYLVWIGFSLLKESTKVLRLFTPETIPVDDIKNVHHIHV